MQQQQNTSALGTMHQQHILLALCVMHNTSTIHYATVLCTIIHYTATKLYGGYFLLNLPNIIKL